MKAARETTPASAAPAGASKKLFRLVRSSTVPCTRELAQEISTMKPSLVEREFNPRREKYLAGKSEDGLLIPFNWSIVTLNGVKERINGQHSSTMLAKLNGSFPDGLFVHLDEYEVDAVEGEVALFRQFDARESARSARDVAGASKNVIPELDHVPLDVAKLAAEGIAWQRDVIERAPVGTGDARYELFTYLNMRPFFVWCGVLFTEKTTELMRVPVLAAMYATFNVDEVAARAFWHEVAQGGTEGSDSPSTVLDEWLTKTKSKDAEKEGLDKLKPGEFWQACIYAWTAHRRGISINSIKYGVTKKGLSTPV
jgi:hypothetical protein